MMTTDAELEVVRRQLDRAEAALDALRREVEPVNAKLFEVLAESYIDLRQSLRADIDTYLCAAPAGENIAQVLPAGNDSVFAPRQR